MTTDVSSRNGRDAAVRHPRNHSISVAHSIGHVPPALRARGRRGAACLPQIALAAAIFILLHLSIYAQTTNSLSGTDILRDLDNFREMGSVLYVAAHPDDENNELIAYLSRGRHYRTAYLSLTRGDGGQNVLGPVFGEDLGVVRTEELLAAGRIDGAQQFFSRAVDFGFSKDYRQTLRTWDEEGVLSDIVRVIREFRPDIVVTRFSLIPGGTHGHHTASAILALQAFKMAGDPLAFPNQLREGLTIWQPKRIFWNVGGFQNRDTNGAPMIRLNDGGVDPLSGEAYTAIAAHSRSMHKTQGFGNFAGFGGGNGPRHDSFELLAGDPATNDIMDGINTTWSGVPGGAVIGELSDEVIAKFNPQDPAASVEELLAIKRRLDPIYQNSADPILHEKDALLDRIIQKCLGLTVQTVIPNAEVVPGETLHLRMTATLRSGVVPVRWQVAGFYPENYPDIAINADLTTNAPVTREAVERLSADTPISQPYWLREPHTAGMFRVDDPNLIGRPENPPPFPIAQVFLVDGQPLIVEDQPVQVTARRSHDEPRDLEIISPVTLKFPDEVELFAPSAIRQMTVEVTARRPHVRGVLRLAAPDGWSISPATEPLEMEAAGDRSQFTFYVTAPPDPASAVIGATVTVNGRPYDNGRVIINYPHLPLLLLQPRAECKATCLNLATRGHRIGYLPGAGDDVAQCIAEMGYDVTNLTDADLTSDRLAKFDAVVIGVRAFNVRDDLASHMPAIFDYAKAGGTVIEQYNRPGFGLKTEQLTPYSLHLSDDRVTDPAAPMTFLAPDNPVLNTPNKITSADFGGWVQERGTYFPDQWDDHFTPILACSDAGEAPLKGGLLVAPYGKGYFVYTGLGFFRQMPAGAPGAYRLFANLLSLGK
ncbi:MAG TPA: PIG-L family deacetylase [Verrucomicrobiae bacterium]|nr:PIG-L family deacetylase [Verrucomicrobiae bacterium]